VSKYTDQSMKGNAVAIQDLVKTEWFSIERDIIKRCKKIKNIQYIKNGVGITKIH